jgi:hypothetical protein
LRSRRLPLAARTPLSVVFCIRPIAPWPWHACACSGRTRLLSPWPAAELPPFLLPTLCRSIRRAPPRPLAWAEAGAVAAGSGGASTTTRPSDASAAARRVDAHTTRNRGALCPLPSVLTSPASPVVLLLANSGGCARVYNDAVVRPAADASSSPLPHLRPSLSSPTLLHPPVCRPLPCPMASTASTNGRADGLRTLPRRPP